jgi:hypothetical protein
MDLIAELTRRGAAQQDCRRFRRSARLLPRGRTRLYRLPGISKSASIRRNSTTSLRIWPTGVLRIAYDKRPDLWLAVAEEHRHEVLLDATDQFRALLREIVNAEYPGQNNMWAPMHLYDEGILRIYRVCGIRQ